MDYNKDKNLDDKHPDFQKIYWNPNYCFCRYKDFESNKVLNCTLSEYLQKYKDLAKESRPKIEKLDVLKVKENLICLIKHYKYDIKFNVIKCVYEIFINGEQSSISLENHVSDILDFGIKKNFKLTKDRLESMIKRIGIDNKYNPIEEYLKYCYKYYNHMPDNKILKKLTRTIKSDCQFKEKYIFKFLLQMVAVGCSKDNDPYTCGQYMLVLQGKQNIGKTTWLKNLLPEKFRNTYFLEGRTFDLNNKDHILESVTNWLVEMGEISSTFRKSDQESLKNFITSNVDKFRVPYDKEASTRKRRVSLCGTTNDVEYLKDLTGSRRFLTLNCLDINKNFEIDINMLWGYIYSIYIKNPMAYKFTDEEVKEIVEFNEQYLNKPEGLLMIEEYYIINPETDEGCDWHTAKQIYNSLNNPTILQSYHKLGREMTKFGIRKKRLANLGYVFNLRLKGGNF